MKKCFCSILLYFALVVVVKLVMLGILPLTLFILALTVVLIVAKLLISSIYR